MAWWRRPEFVGILIVGALSLAGCGSSPDDADGSGNDASDDDASADDADDGVGSDGSGAGGDGSGGRASSGGSGSGGHETGSGGEGTGGGPPAPSCEVANCDDGNPCTVDDCDLQEDECSNLPVAGAPSCDDGDAATSSDACSAEGLCVGEPVVCPVSDVCTSYAPNGTATCTATFHDGDACNDGDACSTASSCSAGDCLATDTFSCSNGGTCLEGGGCDCPAAWQGPTCASDVDECADPGACGGGSKCTNSVGSYSCACLPQFNSQTGRDCLSLPRTARILVFYDDEAARNWGSDVRAHIYQAFLGAKTLVDGALTNPQLTLALAGQIELHPIKSLLSVRSCNTSPPDQPQCTGCWTNGTPPSCQSPLSVDADEVDVEGLLQNFRSYINTKRAALIAKVGAFDAAFLFTGFDLTAGIAGYASIGQMCDTGSVGLVQAWAGDSLALSSLMLTHELGHLLSFNHDSSGDLYIMAPSANTSVTLFSPASLASYTTFMNSGASSCLGVGADSDWSALRCGNGIIDEGEQCDPALVADTCCNATCQLQPECQCANSEPCCASGLPKPAGTVCAASRGSCDAADTCDGLSGACFDSYAAPGSSCPGAGYCLRGGCASRTAQCQQESTPTWTGKETSTRCDVVECIQGTWSATPQDGTICGASKQCVDKQCVASSTLSDYLWVTGAWSSCVDGSATREVTCHDQSNVLATSALCDLDSEPSSTRACTGG